MSENETKTESTVAPAFPQTLPAKPMTPSQFKPVRRLTRDLNTLTRMGELLMLAQSELYTIDMPDPANKSKTRPVGAIDIMDCLMGHEITLICGSVLHSTFRREKDPLTGRYFAVRQLPQPPGKRYYKVEVVEIERAE